MHSNVLQSRPSSHKPLCSTKSGDTTLCPLAGGLGGNTPRGSHSAAAITILNRAIGSVEHNQGRNAAHAELGTEGLDLVRGSKRHSEERHGAVVFLERVSITVAGGEHDGQSTGVFLLELLVELTQSGSETTARRALLFSKKHQ